MHAEAQRSILARMHMRQTAYTNDEHCDIAMTVVLPRTSRDRLGPVAVEEEYEGMQWQV